MLDRDYVVEIKVSMRMRENETEEQAAERIYEQLWTGICASDDFGMEFEYQNDGKIMY